MNYGQVYIIGAGIAGLTGALYLTRRNIPVTVFERHDCVGGLARSMPLEKKQIERFYHFICRPDVELLQLIESIGLQDTLHWKPCQTNYFQNQRLYPFGTPWDLLRFDILPLTQRVRFGLNILHSRYRQTWQVLDQLSVAEWLNCNIGKEAYAQIWEPLLRMKFGERCHEISAAWLWHRIHRVARSRKHVWERESFGYVDGGTAALFQRMVKEIEARGGRVELNTRVERIMTEHGKIIGIMTDRSAEMLPCQTVYSTVPLTRLASLLDGQVSDAYRTKLRSVSYIGVVCLLLHLNQQLTKSFWLNVNDPHIPFNGFIEYSNLYSQWGEGQNYFVYIPFYLPVTHLRYAQADNDLLADCLAGLQLIVPDFQPSWIVNAIISRDPYAQPVCTTHFSESIPAQQGELQGLFLSDASQLYPEDRTLSGMVRLSRQIVEMIAQAWKNE